MSNKPSCQGWCLLCLYATAGLEHDCSSPLLPCFVQCRLQLMAADPLLSAISTGLAAARRAVPEAQGGSEVSAAELREWMVRWEDLQLERPLGRGSFGKVRTSESGHSVCVSGCLMPTMCRSIHQATLPTWLQVYLARWAETPCAVKVLLTTGGRQRLIGREGGRGNWFAGCTAALGCICVDGIGL